MNFPLVARLLGVIMLILAAAFSASLAMAGLLDSPAEAEQTRKAFVAGVAVALFAAALLFRVGRRHQRKFFRKEALCVIGIGWLLASLVGSIPYLVATPEIGFAGACFETASGFTTTGASVFSDIEALPPSILFWRSLTQWIGGVGVVVFFVAILGSLGVGAKMLYANEASGSLSEFDESRVQSTVTRLVILYLALTLACATCYWLAGMGPFDAINHTFATVSSGGFSTRNASIAAFHSPAIEWICIVFMVVAGLNFIVAIRALQANATLALRNTELKAYLLILLVATGLIAATLLSQQTLESVPHAIRAAAFQVVSVMTTTGFATEDFAKWSALPQIVLLLLMVVGGCSGSTAGGIKVSRAVIALRLMLLSVERSFRARVVRQVRMNRQAIGSETVTDVSNFIVLALGCAVASLVVVTLFEPNLQVDTNITMVLACLFNIGPGLAEVGPAENYSFLHPYTKLYLSLLMIMGRLELYAILALFAPALWKRFD